MILLSIMYYKIQYWSERTVGPDNKKLELILFKLTNIIKQLRKKYWNIVHICLFNNIKESSVDLLLVHIDEEFLALKKLIWIKFECNDRHRN